MAPTETSNASWPLVKTTLPARPFPPNSARPTLTTDRLIIRPLDPGDLASLHVLRTQPDVMINTAQGRIDTSIDETRPRLDFFLTPNDAKTFNCAICLKTTGEMIGIGGCHELSSMFGWPAIGYMIRQEYWGRGLTTEFLRAWLDLWCQLPREEIELAVDPRTLPDGEATGTVPELVVAYTVEDNTASQRVLGKCGMEQCLTMREPDLRDPSREVELWGYRYFPGKHPKQ